MTQEASQALVVLVTAPADVAEDLAGALVASRLAACVNILPGVTSIYRWEGAVQRDTEALLVVKTVARHFDALAGLVSRLHPYETPEVIALPVTAGSRAYLGWLEQSVEGGSGG